MARPGIAKRLVEIARKEGPYNKQFPIQGNPYSTYRPAKLQ